MKTNIKIYLKIAAASALIIATALPSFAQNMKNGDGKMMPPSAKGSPRPMNQMMPKASASGSPRPMNQMTRMMERADKEIDHRIMSLTKLSTRLQGMKKITDQDKSGLISIVTNQITELTKLKAKIASDTDPEDLKADVQSITKAYRIYALIMPEIAILAAADRAAVIAETMTTVAHKLETRLNEAINYDPTCPSGTVCTPPTKPNTTLTQLQKALTDIKAKIASATAQIEKARETVSALVPDNGDQVVFKSNNKALKDAHTMIKTAMQDLRASRKSADTIVKGLRKYGTPSPSPSASASPSPTPSSS